MTKKGYGIPPTGGFPKPPKPRSKGKKPRAPRLKAAPDVEVIDVFKAAFEADAGGDAPYDPEAMYQAYLTHRSEAQLKRIDRKIQRACKRRLGADRKLDFGVESAYQRFRETLDHHLEESVQCQYSLQERIRKKLKRLKIQEAEFSREGKIVRISVQGKWFPIRSFTGKFLDKELCEARQLIEEGALIPYHNRHTGGWYVRRAVEDVLKKWKGEAPHG